MLRDENKIQIRISKWRNMWSYGRRRKNNNYKHKQNEENQSLKNEESNMKI